jgi:hypothetical protein
VRIVFALFVFVFIGAALFHAAAIVMPTLGASSPAWRHALFSLINGVCAYGFVRRPRWFVLAFGVLVVQQLWSHGNEAWSVWHGFHQIDWVSLAVTLVMPFALGLLLRETRRVPV